MIEEFTPKVKRSRSEAINDKISRGNDLLKAKRYEEALDVFQEVITVNPENHITYVYAAQALIGMRDYKEALGYANQGLKLNPMNSLVYEIAGEIHLRLKNWDEALKHFQDASQLDSSSVVSYFGMGQVFSKDQQYDEAIRMFRKALTLNREYPKAYACLAKAYLAKKDQEDGIIDICKDDVLDLIARGTHISLIEEEELRKMLDVTSDEDLEERIADLQYITAWLEALLEKFHWQADYIQTAIKSPGRYIIPEGMEEGFEQFL